MTGNDVPFRSFHYSKESSKRPDNTNVNLWIFTASKYILFFQFGLLQIANSVWCYICSVGNFKGEKWQKINWIIKSQQDDNKKSDSASNHGPGCLIRNGTIGLLDCFTCNEWQLNGNTVSHCYVYYNSMHFSEREWDSAAHKVYREQG